MMAVRGVRRSWLTWAMKSLLAPLARSASSLAARNASADATEAVMSVTVSSVPPSRIGAHLDDGAVGEVLEIASRLLGGEGGSTMGDHLGQIDARIAAFLTQHLDRLVERHLRLQRPFGQPHQLQIASVAQDQSLGAVEHERAVMGMGERLVL